MHPKDTVEDNLNKRDTIAERVVVLFAFHMTIDKFVRILKKKTKQYTSLYMCSSCSLASGKLFEHHCRRVKMLSAEV